MCSPVPFLAIAALAVGARAFGEEIQVPSQDIEEMVVRDQRAKSGAIFQESATEMEWVTEEEIDLLPATNAAQIIDNLAGIRTQQRLQGQEAAVSIEGMPPEYTKILVDGQRWSGELGGVGDISDIPLQNVSRIEVLRGSQGVTYGTDAAGGVINVVTHTPPAEGIGGELEFAGGSANHGLAGGTARLRMGPLGLSLSGEYDRIDGFDPDNDPDIARAQAGGKDSLFEQYFAYGKWDLPLGDAITLRGNGLWRIEDDQFATIDGESQFERKDTSWRANAGLDGRFDNTHFRGDVTFYAVDTTSSVGRSFDLLEEEINGAASIEQYIETGPISHFLRVGGRLEVQQLDLNEGPLPPEIDNPDLEAGRQLVEDFVIPSVYAQLESELTPWFTLSLGIRGQFHSEFESKVLPQVGLLAKPLDALNLRATWGINYRTPSLRDLYQPPTPQQGGAYFLEGNPDLTSETSTSVRGGFEWNPVPWASLAAAGFYNDIDDFIRSAFAGSIPIGTFTELVDPLNDAPSDLVAICEAQASFFPNADAWTPQCASLLSGEPVERLFVRRSNVFQKTNIDAVRTWGIESQLRLRIHDWAQLRIDYSWLRTKIVDSNVQGDELPNEPAHVVNVRTTFAAPEWASRLSMRFQWRDEVIPDISGLGLLSFADSSRRTDHSIEFDLRLTQPLGQGIEIYLDALNLIDEARSDSYAIRGRTFFAGIKGRFGAIP